VSIAEGDRMNNLERFIRSAYAMFSARTPPAALRQWHQNDPGPTLTYAEQREVAGLLNACTAADVGLHASMSRVRDFNGSSTIYIDIANNKWFSLGIFVLSPGSRIPLHNHPAMCGTIKVIHGEIRITSYTMTEVCGQEVHCIQDPPVLLTKSSPPALLRPDEGNIHELEFVAADVTLPQHNYAAFIDFLTPPYDDTADSNACNYYRVKEGSAEVENQEGKNKVTLIQCPSPDEYSTDVGRYKGPSLKFIAELEAH